MTPASRTLLWRIHGLAALLALPFLLVALVTGLIYLPMPQSKPGSRACWSGFCRVLC